MELNVKREVDLIEKLKGGFPIGFPTDTVPALATKPEYASKLWEIKNRPRNKPLILMASTPKELFKEVLKISLADAFEMAEVYWPGPLTMVLPSKGQIVKLLNPASSSIGLRVPNSEFARNFLQKTGPLATTSANLSGTKTSLSPQDVDSSFPNLPLLGPLPWPTASGMASTLIAWESVGNWRLIRRGAVIPEKLQN